METVVLTRKIGRDVRAKRTASGMTQGELAAQAGVSERLVRSLEAGVATGISLENLVKVLNVFGIRLAVGEEAPVQGDSDGGREYSMLLRQAMQTWDGVSGDDLQ